MTQSDNIILVGFSGSGKSTVGVQLAKRLKTDFVDTDKVIENRTGTAVTEIFRTKGERKFRELEKQALAKVLHRDARSKVVALGGGALLDAVNRRLVFKAGTVIYLSCSQRELYRRLAPMNDRPLLHVTVREGQSRAQTMRAQLVQLLEARLKYYRQADIAVSTTNRSVSKTVAEIIRRLEQHRERNQSKD